MRRHEEAERERILAADVGSCLHFAATTQGAEGFNIRQKH